MLLYNKSCVTAGTSERPRKCTVCGTEEIKGSQIGDKKNPEVMNDN